MVFIEAKVDGHEGNKENKKAPEHEADYRLALENSESPFLPSSRPFLGSASRFLFQRGSIFSNRSALKITTRETPMSAAIAAHNDAVPANVRTTKIAFTPSESVMFCRMIESVRFE